MPALYSTEDLLADESFQAYALGTDAAAVQHWQAWLAQNPAQEASFREAEAVLHLLRTGQRPQPSAELKQQETARLWQALNAPALPAAPRLRSARPTRRWPVALGALLLAVLAAGLLWVRRPARPAYVRYAAPATAPRTVALPDGSHVVLEAGSVLTVAANWPAKQARQVWLRGSAYFDVQHLAPPAMRSVPGAPVAAKFVVHAGPLDVAVLGTQFTVFSHGSRTKVVLSEGQIELSRTQGHAERLLLHPGELAECDAAAPNAPLLSREVKPRLYTAWTSGQLDFDDLPVADIVATLQDTYGLQITVRDPQLLRQRLSGSLPTQDLNAMLAAFGKILDAQVHRQGNQVWID